MSVRRKRPPPWSRASDWRGITAHGSCRGKLRKLTDPSKRGASLAWHSMSAWWTIVTAPRIPWNRPRYISFCSKKVRHPAGDR
jgi:hypothetical protein